ncbi:MAG: DoxX family protein, partial [Sulfurimonas sp.]|nr:DoxX family protein [Sulfurimonas sp.]
YKEFISLSEYGKSVSLLLVRLILAYSFFEPAKMKWNDIGAIAQWFEYMGIPLPTLNAYMAAGTEALGVVLLTLGLFTRLISVPLIIVMIVAIVTVHGVNGFAMVQAGSEVVDAWVNGVQVVGTIVTLQNGYEMPLYYILFLLVLLTQGGGKLSFDRFIFGEKS